jgi:hypothetical protein
MIRLHRQAASIGNLVAQYVAGGILVGAIVHVADGRNGVLATSLALVLASAAWVSGTSPDVQRYAKSAWRSVVGGDAQEVVTIPDGLYAELKRSGIAEEDLPFLLAAWLDEILERASPRPNTRSSASMKQGIVLTLAPNAQRQLQKALRDFSGAQSMGT